MMTLETTDYSMAALAAEIQGTSGAFARLKVWIAARRKRRELIKAYSALERSEEYLLRDIGLTRYDVGQMLARSRAL